MEVKINNGLERSITAIISWIKIILNTEQKKTDFEPETEDIEMMQTPTCVKVVRFLNLKKLKRKMMRKMMRKSKDEEKEI